MKYESNNSIGNGSLLIKVALKQNSGQLQTALVDMLLRSVNSNASGDADSEKDARRALDAILGTCVTAGRKPSAPKREILSRCMTFVMDGLVCLCRSVTCFALMLI